MNIVVPLAGPDYFSRDGICKGDTIFNGEPFLPWVLKSRDWYCESNNYFFILIDSEYSRHFADAKIKRWFPNSLCIFMPMAVNGAALSTLHALPFLDRVEDHFLVDLADIKFKSNFSDFSSFYKNKNCDAVALSFFSNHKQYSYFEVNENNEIFHAKEKSVISNNASVGVYSFRTVSVYYECLAWYLNNRRLYTHNNLYYLSPILNGVVRKGRIVLNKEVFQVCDVKLGGAVDG